MSLLRDQCAAILRSAVESRLGIQVRVLESGGGVVTPSLRAKQILYRFRKELGDAEFQTLAIRLCPHDPDHVLWITRQPEKSE